MGFDEKQTAVANLLLEHEGIEADTVDRAKAEQFANFCSEATWRVFGPLFRVGLM